ncbi:hypothetical protein JI435_008380 [Parastagonospora nodorum SN15]|uniref:Uncharacterized protein n=1 Tax=Phaeosphaeria nodorum (strain SN15 / ATCC MYA-4574 / FGSC 10173) TaxID=321614 RepID=A0A7U2ESR2_PHANO|nr:hypothetical protein JI435_008380 [Parastagonospora nodorum SN15]
MGRVRKNWKRNQKVIDVKCGNTDDCERLIRQDFSCDVVARGSKGV